MKRTYRLTAVLALLLILCTAACAQAADIRPVDTDRLAVDLNNGVFCLGIRDMDRIADGGYFTAALYLKDHYEAAQIEALAPGDTVLVNDQAWTVREIVVHEGDKPGLADSYEIYPTVENDSYIVFSPGPDGYYFCVTDDWSPVSPVAEVRIMLPLPDQFEYTSSEADRTLDMDGFLNDLEAFGNEFVPYNTTCTFRDGLLVQIIHDSYPCGPSGTSGEGSESADGVPVWQFCHGKREGLETAVIKGYSIDCEEGPAEIEMTPEETESIRSIAVNGVITGKANDMSVTGGTWVYAFETPEGESLLYLEMYKGWIVDVSGMYNYTE